MSLLLPLVALVGSAFAEPYRMNDVGGALELPAGFDVEENGWADWEFKARSRDPILFKLWLTSFQVIPDDASMKVWTGQYADGLRKDKLKNVTMESTSVGKLGEYDNVGRTKLSFTIEGGGKGVAHFAAIATEGQVVHLRTLGSARFDKKAEAALVSFVENFKLDKGPTLADSQRVESETGFAATLPDGWRAPLPKEMDAVRKVSEKVGEELAPDDCWVAIKPPPAGTVDVMWACKAEVHLPPVDEYSFAGVEQEVYDTYFGRAKQEVPHAEQVTIGDRVGFYYRPPVATSPVRLAIAPYEGGQMVLWAFAGNLDATGLDAAVQGTLPTVEFTGADGGHPIISADKWAMHYLKYRTTSPFVLGPAVLLLLAVGGGGLAVARGGKKNKYDDI